MHRVRRDTDKSLLPNSKIRPINKMEDKMRDILPDLPENSKFHGSILKGES